MDRAAQLISALQEHGYRATPQRAAVCRVLAASREHLTPYAVYEQVRREQAGVSRATVYNTLTILRDLGELTEVGLGQEEIHYEADPQPHANLICLNCGRIIDVADPAVELLSRQLAGAHAFTLRSARTDIYGYCRDCQAQATA